MGYCRKAVTPHSSRIDIIMFLLALKKRALEDRPAQTHKQVVRHSRADSYPKASRGYRRIVLVRLTTAMRL